MIYVSTPLWVRVDVHDPPQFLQEIPVIRPSDTWFGPSTREGELGYAGRTHGRLNFENGDGPIQILYLDTPGVRARAYGSINLASETVDIVIKPESKRRLFGSSSPVRIKGPLNDPSVSKIPANEAAILAAQLAVPIIALPARALGLLWSLIRDDKDENSPCLTGDALDKIK